MYVVTTVDKPVGGQQIAVIDRMKNREGGNSDSQDVVSIKSRWEIPVRLITTSSICCFAALIL